MALRHVVSRVAHAWLGSRAAQQQVIEGALVCSSGPLAASFCGEAPEGGRSGASPSPQLAAAAWRIRSVTTSATPESPAKGSSRSSRKSKKREEPVETKPGITSYTIFCREQFQKARNDLPRRADGMPADASLVIKEVAKRWATLSADAKAKYKQLADTDLTNVQYAVAQEKKHQRSMTGWRLFVQEAMPQYLAKVPVDKKGLAKGQAAMVMVVAGWKQLTKEQKAIYNDKAAGLRLAA